MPTANTNPGVESLTGQEYFPDVSRLLPISLFLASMHVLACDPVPTPTNLTATALSPYRVQLNWSPVPGFSQYRVQRSPTGTNAWVTIAQISVTGTTPQWDDPYVPGGMTYFYQVQAGSDLLFCDDPCCLSPYTDPVSVTTPAGAVPCPLETTRLRAQIWFTRSNVDQVVVKANVCLPADYDTPNVAATLQICGVPLDFILDHVGIGVYAFQNQLGILRYSTPQHVWKLRGTFKHGEWSQVWAPCGLVNADIPAPGAPVTMPVSLHIGDESFTNEIAVLYRAKENIRGQTR